MTVYIISKQNVKVSTADVYIQDIADIFSDDKAAQARLETTKIYSFAQKSGSRAVIGVLDIIDKITTLYPKAEIESLGETDTIVETESYIKGRYKRKDIKVFFICLICFLGTAFTIMAFHNDIGISEVIDNMSVIFTGETQPGVLILQIAYSIGLMLGIILFYNHIGTKRLSDDPTPLEVGMRDYEREVNQAVVDMFSRKKEK